MFDAHILYYCYDNLQGDEFGVGALGNKDDWCYRMNTWNRNDNIKHKYTIEEWDDLDAESDLRGCVLAEVVPYEEGYLITWFNDEVECGAKIDSSWKVSIEDGSPVPRWVSRLKNQLRELGK